MTTLSDIHSVLMEETDRGTRAIGRALVLLFISSKAKHNDSIGLAMSRYYMQYHTLSDNQVAYWRKLDKNGIPKIFEYADELLQLSITKEKRRIDRYANITPDVIDIINQRKDLYDVTLDLLETSEYGLIRQALVALRKFERLHGMSPMTINDTLMLLDQEISVELNNVCNSRNYLNNTNGT